MRIAVAVAFVLATVTSGAARAQDATPETLIARGLELRRESKPEPALEMFKRAHALAASARTLGQMGLVEASLERWLDADAHLTASLALSSDAWVRKNWGLLTRALGVARPHVGELLITGPAGTEVAIDGQSIGKLPADQPLKHLVGNAFVTANGLGFKQFSKTVAIAGGAKVSLAIVMDPVENRPALALAAPLPTELPAEVPPEMTVATPPGGRPWRRWTGATLVAAGGGLLAWGIGWIAVDGKDQCSTGGPACATVFDTRTAGWILTAAGAAAAVGGGALLVITRRRDEPGVAVAATPTALLLSGRF